MRKRFIVIGSAGLCAAFFAAGVVAQPVGPVAFTLENAGGSRIQALRLSRPQAESWGPDRLAGPALAPGDADTVALRPGLGGCLYDLKAEFESGAEARLFAVDVCRLNGATLALSD